MRCRRDGRTHRAADQPAQPLCLGGAGDAGRDPLERLRQCGQAVEARSAATGALGGEVRRDRGGERERATVGNEDHAGSERQVLPGQAGPGHGQVAQLARIRPGAVVATEQHRTVDAVRREHGLPLRAERGFDHAAAEVVVHGQQRRAGLVRGAVSEVRLDPVQDQQRQLGEGLAVRQEGRLAAVTTHRSRLPRGHRLVRPPRHQLEDGGRLPGDEGLVGSVQHEADPVAPALPHRRLDRRPHLEVRTGDDQVHLPAPQDPGRDDGAVQDQVRRGERERRILGAGRLPLGQVDDDVRPAGRLGAGLQLATERKAGAAAAAQPDPLEVGEQGGELRMTGLPMSRPVGREGRSRVDRREERGSAIDVDADGTQYASGHAGSPSGRSAPADATRRRTATPTTAAAAE